MSYLSIKAVHIIFVICWFAGLFYLGRMFIYFKEAENRVDNEKKILQKQFLIMSERVMNIIIWPSVFLASTFGSLMLYYNPGLLGALWMKIKLIVVLFLLVYVFVCQHILNLMKKGILNISENKLRFFSEGATLFLIAIVSIASLKTEVSWIYFTAIFIIISVLLSILIKLYQKYLLKKN
tara:strand:+ start:544 stop:1083 length:540 start_codon:yes stop_codon:yes gene_type:complete